MKYKRMAESHDGWFLVSIIERFEGLEEDSSKAGRRCVSWENTHIVKASSVEQAYDKITEHYRSFDKDYVMEFKGRRGKWVFEGVTDLVPIYEPLEDLSEILWTEHNNVSVRTVKNKVYSKEELLSHYLE